MLQLGDTIYFHRCSEDPTLSVLLKIAIFRQKSGVPRPMRAPRFRHLCQLHNESLRAIQGGRQNLRLAIFFAFLYLQTSDGASRRGPGLATNFTSLGHRHFTFQSQAYSLETLNTSRRELSRTFKIPLVFCLLCLQVRKSQNRL